MIDEMEEFHRARFSTAPLRHERAFEAARQLLFHRQAWRDDPENFNWLDCLSEDQIEFGNREYPSFARCVVDLAMDHEDPLMKALCILRITTPSGFHGGTPQVWTEQRFAKLCGWLNELEWMSFEGSFVPRVSSSNSLILSDSPKEARESALLNSVSELLPSLKGKQKRVLTMLIEAGGSMPIADIATDKMVDWMVPYKSSVDGVKTALNKKLRKRRVHLSQQNNCLYLKTEDSLRRPGNRRKK